MLKKDVDYVPQSPKKLPPPPASGLAGRPTHQKSLSSSTSLIPRTSSLGHSRTRSQATLLRSPTEEMSRPRAEEAGPASPSNKEGRGAGGSGLSPQKIQDCRRGQDASASKWKTTEEKKELLGTMLGNVDALVEGVRKAGIWGLG